MIRATLLLFVILLVSALQAQQPCAAKLGGNYYINCKSLISYRGQDVVTFSDWSDPIASVNLDVYNTSKKLEAQVLVGKLVKGSAERFKIKSSAEEFSLIDGETDRVICVLKSVLSTSKDATCMVNVWLDLYVNGEGYFQCDPEKSNDALSQYMNGATFRNSHKAIVLD